MRKDTRQEFKLKLALDHEQVPQERIRLGFGDGAEFRSVQKTQPW